MASSGGPADVMRANVRNAAEIEALLGPGGGLCLDLGCGCGLYFAVLASTGRTVVGLDRSADQLHTFLGERYRRIARRRGAKKANVAIGRSILVIIWHLMSDPQARYNALGADFYATRIDPDRRRRNHVRQLEALGYKVILVILERAA